MLLVADSVGLVADPPSDQAEPTAAAERAAEARDRVHFEEEALEHADQLYRMRCG
jgi:hypothetical protein